MGKRWASVGLVLLGLVVAIALNACDPQNFKKDTAQVSQIVLSTLSDPKTFNPALGNEFPPAYLLTHEGLVGEDGNGNIVPAIAESWEFSPDKKRIKFRLRQGLKWSDGQPLTVEDVLFTFNEIYLNESIPTDTRDVMRIGEKGLLPTLRKVDDAQIEFILPEPFSPILRSLAGYILPAHILQESVRAKDSEGRPKFLAMWGTDTPPKNIVGSGPYVLEDYVTSQRVVFRRNPYYWQKDEQGNAKPHVERVIWQILESLDTDLLRFRSGELDILGSMSTIRPEDFSILKREEKRGKFNIQFGGPRAGTLFLSFNLNQGKRGGKPVVDPIKSRWFNTKEFRQAVAYALDRQSMIDRIYRGLAQTQNSPISVQSPYYLSPEQGLKTYDQDLKKARELLLQAGFKYNDKNQLLDADGNPVRFSLVTNAGNKIRESLGTQVKQDLARIGIQVDFTPIAFNVLLDKLDNSLDWEAYILGFTGGVEPNSGFNIWNPDGASHTFNQKPQAGVAPVEGRVVADWELRIKQLYVQAAQALDENARKELYFESQRVTQEYLPFIYLVNSETMAAIRDRVQGVKYTALGYTYWNIQDQRVAD